MARKGRPLYSGELFALMQMRANARVRRRRTDAVRRDRLRGGQRPTTWTMTRRCMCSADAGAWRWRGGGRRRAGGKMICSVEPLELFM